MGKNMNNKIENCTNISFTDVKTGEVKLETQYTERFTFDTFENKKPIGKLKGKLENKNISEDIEIDIYTAKEVDGKIIINDYIELGRCSDE